MADSKKEIISYNFNITTGELKLIISDSDFAGNDNKILIKVDGDTFTEMYKNIPDFDDVIKAMNLDFAHILDGSIDILKPAIENSRNRRNKITPKEDTAEPELTWEQKLVILVEEQIISKINYNAYCNGVEIEYHLGVEKIWADKINNAVDSVYKRYIYWNSSKKDSDKYIYELPDSNVFQDINFECGVCGYSGEPKKAFMGLNDFRIICPKCKSHLVTNKDIMVYMESSEFATYCCDMIRSGASQINMYYDYNYTTFEGEGAYGVFLLYGPADNPYIMIDKYDGGCGKVIMLEGAKIGGDDDKYHNVYIPEEEYNTIWEEIHGYVKDNLCDGCFVTSEHKKTEINIHGKISQNINFK